MSPIAILTALATVATASDILVVDFTGKEKATTHTWRTNNDPVMGGKSYSTVSIENGLLNFTGAVSDIADIARTCSSLQHRFLLNALHS